MKSSAGFATQRGYTLIEALVVVAIVGLVSLVVVPNFISLYRASKVKTALRQFTNDVRSARQRAVTQNKRVDIVLDTGATQDSTTHAWTVKNTYRIYEGTRQSDGTYVWTKYADKQFEPDVYFDSSSFTDSVNPSSDSAENALKDIVYEESGSLNIPSGLSLPATVVIKTYHDVPRKQYTVTFNYTGQIKAQ